MNDRPIPESGSNARRGCVRIGAGVLAILLISALVAWRVLVIANRPPHLTIATHTVPEDNAYDVWVSAGKKLSGLKPQGPISDARPRESWTLPELQAFEDANKPVLDLCRQGLNRPYCFPAIRGVSANLDQFRVYARFRELARRLLSESIYYRAAGHPERAAQSCLDAVEMGVLVPKGGTLVTALVGSAIESIGCSGLPDLLPLLSRQDLLGVQSRIARIQAARVPVSEIILEDGHRSVSMWQQRFQNPSFLRSLTTPSATYAAPSPEQFTREPRVPRMSAREAWDNLLFAFQHKKAALLDLQEHYETLARETEGTVYKGPLRDNASPGRMNRNTAASMDTAIVAAARNRAVLELLRTDCALRRYRMDHGRYPDFLSQLVPRYVKSVPMDPCGGKPLKYRALKGGRDFLLYSIGPNLKDDGGLAGNWRDPDAKSDIVEGRWHLPSTP